MKRKLYNSLIEWKNDPDRKPLVLEGARQVGKTWLLKEFGKNEFDNLLYVNCHDDERMQNLFQQDLHVDRIMQAPLSARQLAAAKRQLKGQLTIAADNREQFALDMAKHFLHYGKERSLDQLIAQIDAITAAQLQDVAQQLFAPEHMQQLIL